jgi:alcohol dehydrogenase class IV
LFFCLGANPWSDIACQKALQLTGEFIVRAVHDPNDEEARERMMFASTLAGAAFGNVGCHMPHGMSYPVSGMIHELYGDLSYYSDSPPSSSSSSHSHSHSHGHSCCHHHHHHDQKEGGHNHEGRTFLPLGYPAESAPLVPHGFSVILNAPAVFRWTADACPDRHLAAAGFLGADIRVS